MPDAVWVGGYTRGLQHCATCGSTVEDRHVTQHVNFHKSYTYRRDQEMSDVKWCDYGDHAYKAGAKGSASFDAAEIDEDTGVAVRTTMDACKEHNPLNVARQAERYGLTMKGYKELNALEDYEAKDDE